MANSDPVGSLMRGIDILKLIGDAENGLKICEIAVALNLKQPTCYNLVRTLAMCGFVEKRNNRLYLGQELIQLAKKHSGSAFFAGVETELLALYQRLPRCTVIFAVPGPQGMLQTHRIAFERPGVIQHLDSEPMHIYASAAGLVFLAFLSGETAQIRINERWPFAEFGAYLWKTRAELNAYLDKVRRTKIAVSPFDQDVSVRVSAAVLDRGGRLIATVGVSLPVQQMRNTDLRTVQKEVLLSALRISSISGS